MRQWKQRTTKGGKEKDEMDGKDQRKLELSSRKPKKRSDAISSGLSPPRASRDSNPRFSALEADAFMTDHRGSWMETDDR